MHIVVQVLAVDLVSGRATLGFGDVCELLAFGVSSLSLCVELGLVFIF